MIIWILICVAVATIPSFFVIKTNKPGYALLILLILLILPIALIVEGCTDNMPSSYRDNGYYEAVIERENSKDITIIFQEYKEENNCVVIQDYYLFKFKWWGFPVYDYQHINDSIIIKLPNGGEFQYLYHQGKDKQREIEDCESMLQK